MAVRGENGVMAKTARAVGGDMLLARHYTLASWWRDSIVMGPAIKASRFVLVIGKPIGAKIADAARVEPHEHEYEYD